MNPHSPNPQQLGGLATPRIEEAATRPVALGRVFSKEVPLGPTREITLTSYSSASGKGKLHGTQECGKLRATHGVTDVALSFHEAAWRLCTHCRWPLPVDSPILPLGAAVATVSALALWLDREDDSQEDINEECDASTALATGQFSSPASDDDSVTEEDQDDEFARYDRARGIRTHRYEHWRRLHTYLVESNEAVSEFAFLAPWAADLQRRFLPVLEVERRAFAALLQPTSLLEASAVRLLPKPEFAAEPDYAGLGADARRTFQRVWFDWSRRATWSWSRLEDHDFTVSCLVRDAIGRRRKGLAEALTSFGGLAAEWTTQARAEADRHMDAPWQLVGVKVPALPYTRFGERAQDPLTAWEAAVIATYQVAFNPTAGTAALLVPHLIAGQLTTRASSTMPVKSLGTHSNAATAEHLLTQWSPGRAPEQAASPTPTSHPNGHVRTWQSRR